MKYLKKFGNLFKDLGNFHIVFIPMPGQEEQDVTLTNTSRKEAIKEIVRQYPQIKIKKIEKVITTGDIEDIDPEAFGED